MKDRPIGIIDSGLGGLTVAKEIKNALPDESIVYVGDCKRTPYGDKSGEEIFRLSQKLITFLVNKNVKLIVIACNTITVTSIERLRASFINIPIVGVVPVVKTAVTLSKNKHIGILSTTKTAKSDMQKELINTFASEYTVINKGTDRIVPLIENGLWKSKKMTVVLRQVLQIFNRSSIDTLVLGCTHYPFVTEQIQHIVGEKVQILDSGSAIGRQVTRILHNNSISQNTEPTYHFYTTGAECIMQDMVIERGFTRNTFIKTISL